MTQDVRNSGAFYSYISRGLGRPTGAGAAYVAVAAYNLMEVGLLAAFGFFAQQTVDDLFGFDLVWYWWAIAGGLLIGLLGYLRVTLSAKVLGVALVLEVLVLVVFECGVIADRGLGAFTFESFDIGQLLQSPGIGGLFVFGIGAFIGFEATAIYAEEVRDRERSVPRATYVAVAFLALFYGFTVWTAVAYFGADEVQSIANGDGGADMIFAATESVAGHVVADCMRLLIVTSAFAATLAFHNVSARYFFALGREGLLPGALARISRHKSPVNAVLLQTLLGLGVVVLGAVTGSDPYLVVLLWANGPGVLGIMALQALAGVAVVAYFRRDRRGHGIFRVVIAPGLAVLGLVALLWLVVAKFSLLTAASTTTNMLLILPLPVLFVLGVARARHLRSTAPARYAALATTNVDDDSVLDGALAGEVR
jgi:amino acid transporter